VPGGDGSSHGWRVIGAARSPTELGPPAATAPQYYLPRELPSEPSASEGKAQMRSLS
jgi:hypothetical protein